MKSLRFRHRRPVSVAEKSTMLTFVQSWVPIIAVVMGGLYGVWKYQDEKSEKTSEAVATRKVEAQRPFLIKKMDLFFEAAQVAGKLASVEINSDEWKTAKRKIYELRWATLELAGNPVVRQAMRDVITAMKNVEDISLNEKPKELEAKQKELRFSVECLADELRYSLEEQWGNPVQPLGFGGALLRSETRTSLPSGCYRPDQIKTFKWDDPGN